MAYAAVVSLKQTIKGLARSSLISSTRETLEFAHNEVASLQKAVETLYSRSSERLEGLDGEIRDAAHELEDVLEFHESEQLYSDVEVKKAIGSFAEAAKKLAVEYVEELSKPDDDAATTLPPSIDFGVEMVGRSEMFSKIRATLIHRMRPDDMFFFLLLGEDGSGKRFVAKTVYEDVGKGKQFDCCAWVTIGAQYQFKEVLMQFISQVWEHRRYMIVLDDVRDVEVVAYLRIALPNRRDGSIVFVISSAQEMLGVTDNYISFYTPAHYFEESIWLTIRGVICGDGPISPQLEEAGKKIIYNCRGSSISAAKALLFLLKTDTTIEKWREIASDQENPIFMLGDEISEMSNIKAQMQSCNWDLDDARQSLIVRIISAWGFIEEIENIKKELQPERFFSRMQVLSLLGMAGIGKSTLARKIFNDEWILYYFDHHVWVTLGPKYQTKQVLIDILTQIYPSIDKMHMKGDDEITQELCTRLSGKKCLIVLDDICSQEPLHHMKNAIPNIMGITLVTTRLAEVAKFTKGDVMMKMKLLDQEESWSLFRQKVFGEESIPSELEKAGRKIAKKCEGLPLLILTVADQLLKVEKTVDSWNDKEKSVFKKAHDEISKELLPSYESLRQHLKVCFLYMSVFRNDYEIPLSKLTNLLTAEGFLETNQPQTVGEFVGECLSELVDRSLVMAQNNALDFQIKTCRLHPIIWHLSNSEAAKNKFFLGVNGWDSFPFESIESQRRLSIRNNILLGMKDVQDSIASITTARSLLCVGPPHQYPVPVDFDLRLLRVMDALTIRFYEFPVEVGRLVHLRHLGLTCNGDLPTWISNLWKLQHLIVKRYMTIKSFKSCSPLPMEIWDMKELVHLQVMGGRLSDHKCNTTLLKLSTLLDVSAESCTQEVLESIPNLKKLGIRIELAPDDEGTHFHYLNNIHLLRGLESLKCVVVNPQIRSEVTPLPPPYFMFPPSLKSLSLNGMGYPWEYMSIISELGNLQVLKLKGYAFQGPQWIMDHRTGFNNLRFLLVEDSNLEQWEIKIVTMGKLEGISFKHCYKLQEIPMCLQYQCFTKVEIVDCNPRIMKWAEIMKKEMAMTDGEVVSHASWHGHSKAEED